MSDYHIVSPRILRITTANRADLEARQDTDLEPFGTVKILWGACPQFGAYLAHHRERANLSLRKAADVLNVSHTHLAQFEQYQIKSAPSLDFLARIAELYGLKEYDVLHEAGYRFEAPIDVLESIYRRAERDFRAIMLCDEYRVKDASEDLLDLFPPAVRSYLAEFAEQVDANARRGGPTPGEILARERRAQ